VGWNELRILRREPLFRRIERDLDFYFVHSYRVVCAPDLVAAECVYGEAFVAALQKDNVHAVQFHPEKSQTNGLKLLRGFAELALSGAEAGRC
jgi:imidazole glycerol-phosphate synthase subunit HisH